MSSSGAGATILTMAAVGWIATAGAELLAFAALGAVVIGIGILVLIVMGVIVYAQAAVEATQANDKVWLTNIILAPIVAVVSVFVLHPLYSAYWSGLIHAGQALLGQNGSGPSTNNEPVYGPIVALGLGIVMFASIIIAPIAAVVLMTMEERIAQVGSYAAFLYTAGYWGIALATWTGHANWYPS